MSILVSYAPVPSTTTAQYDEVVRRLQESGELPADGFEYHVAFHSGDQLQVTEVWDSQEQFEAFGQRVMPLLADVALEHTGQPEILSVHNIKSRVAGIGRPWLSMACTSTRSTPSAWRPLARRH